MKTIEARMSVGRIVAEIPQAAAIFEEAGIDYCCHGAQVLEEACRERGLDLRKMLEAIHEAQQSSTSDTSQADRFNELSLSQMCDHIEATHHQYLKQELPRLDGLIQKVVEVHAAQHPELLEAQRVFRELRQELEPHMFKEERILFPSIRLLERSAVRPFFPFGTLANPIGVMVHEHDVTATALAKLEQLTSHYTAPADACESYRALYGAFRRLAADLRQHMHKENNILFPAAQEREASLQ